ncbi:hypothetical protein OUZ56_030688 [Daphnia magna]|uniref:Uncharacterized protein n=1 Tax=Daphnia magna TaxID=35525 RepID=A0ABQ9ZTB5_9CRUS|nr:hypothetical protein OUZ56_030688 [Daphnia magna]
MSSENKNGKSSGTRHATAMAVFSFDISCESHIRSRETERQPRLHQSVESSRSERFDPERILISSYYSL